ncbi:MAG: sigma-54-dependent Fis family transcriptional regulator [Myxococcales bacterium]|nr:sigma-54-dependent Fis family transcriptional regulator [Myxococcales bacterium]
MAIPVGKQPLFVLIVDDEVPFAALVADHLERAGIETQCAHDGAQALLALRQRMPDLLLMDLQMPRMTGLEVIEVLARQERLPPTVVMSAYGSLETALEAIRLGAVDYLSKPFRLAEAELKVRLAVEKARQHALAPPPLVVDVAADDAATVREEDVIPQGRSFYGMVGQTAPILALFRQVERIARFASTVLITGESGSGKELVARALHLASPRARQPFVAVNCGAIQPNLLESELFGHVRGAFTDAHQDRRGLFEEAHGGTLFLDEIIDLPLSLQVKLLRVLQESEVRRVGSNRPIAVDVRVLAAAAVNPRLRVRDGGFREDLYYRLSVIELAVPPLRERRDDIDMMIEHFVEKTNQRLGTQIRAVQPAARAKLIAHHWPGNVRELCNVIEQACVLADGGVLTAELVRLDRSPGGHEAVALPARDTLSIPDAVEATERALILAALQQTAGNRTHAADLLAISPRNLQYKIKQYAIDVPAPVGRPPRPGG